MRNKIPVAVIGATGIVGQTYVSRLADHPWFSIQCVAASAEKAGQPYGEVVRWLQPSPIPQSVASLPLTSAEEVDVIARECQLVFSCIGDKEAAYRLEAAYAEAGLLVVSNTSAHRSTPDVPIIIPEINPHHLDAIAIQRRNRGWKGGLVTKPNCTVPAYLLPLWVMQKQFGVSQALITTMQAISGAGLPGVASMEIFDNVIPYIGGEEEKSESEPAKILGDLAESEIRPFSRWKLAAHCNRVPVMDGHMACVSCALTANPSVEEVINALAAFVPPPVFEELPTAPKRSLVIRSELDRPQTRLDRDADGGMAITVGRIRPCPVMGYRFVGLTHNTVRGAAGGAILIAELLAKRYLYEAQRQHRPNPRKLPLSRNTPACR